MRGRSDVCNRLWFPLVALVAVVLTWSQAVQANDPLLVRARPRIAGDTIPEMKVEDITGNSHALGKAIRDKYAMIVFIPAEVVGQKNIAAYFKTIRSFIEELGYEIFVVTTKPNAQQRAAMYERKLANLYIDTDNSAFVAMGLSDSKSEKASVLAAIFLTSPTGKVLSSFSSRDPNIPFSGDALVLSARVYKQIDDKNRAAGIRSGPTVAPVIGESPYAGSVFDPDSSSTAPEEARPSSEHRNSDAVEDGNFAQPDESVLRLLTVDDVAQTNSYWMQGNIGLTAYDARRNIWSPRWSPGLQFGRRYNRFGVFANLALDQTFDLTQEVKRLDVIHVGLGVESLALYGRVRTSLSAGFAILNSDTDIESRGKIGWYFDLRPISLRWGAGGHSAFELTPLGLNVSVPVTRGIPLILVGYMTTLSFEWASEHRP
jgi:peroxiredoxin